MLSIPAAPVDEIEAVTDPMSGQDHYQIRPEEAADIPIIDALVFDAFGPGARTRAAFRVREQAPHLQQLSFVGISHDTLIASVRLTPVAVGSARGLLLGPLVVNPRHAKKGYGRRLLEHAVIDVQSHANELEYEFIILVGNEPYYGPFGFRAIDNPNVRMPGPVDPARLLLLALSDRDFAALEGTVTGIKP